MRAVRKDLKEAEVCLDEMELVGLDEKVEELEQGIGNSSYL